MIFNRIAQGIRKQDWFTAVLELIILVFGIYIGLQVDDWVGERRDREVEQTYLDLLGRDLAELQRQLADQIAFERNFVEVAGQAYTLLMTSDPSVHGQELGVLLAELSGRRTLSLTSATFEQMVSSGHLQLIIDRALRDRLVSGFARLKRDEKIIGKNNQDLVDDIYSPFLLETGLSVRFPEMQPDARRERTQEIMLAQLGAGFHAPPDEVLARPPDAESWSEIRRQVLFRMYIAAIGQAKAEEIERYLVGMAGELKEALGNR